MSLPNPFSKVENTQPTPIPAISNPNVYNPGPGLPQATIPTYHYTPPPPNPAFNNRQPFSGGGSEFWRNSGQNASFFCDRCDRSLRSQELLDAHIAEHVTCGIDGCPFAAHPKVVDLHVQMQHKTGKAQIIMELTSPEEINKWREGRKR